MNTIAMPQQMLAGSVESIPKSSFDYSAAKDLTLAELSGNGDMLAFEEIYQRHHRRIYSICLRMLQNVHEAEDLTQDTFLQLHRKIGTFKGKSAFTTWYHRIAVNQVLMHWRKKTVKYEVATHDSEIPDTVVVGSANPRRMSVDAKLILEQAIETLPNGYKNVYILHDIEGFEHEEVARILGWAEGTSKSQLHKARQKLRREAGKQANPKLA